MDSNTKKKEILYKMMHMYDKDRPIYNPDFNKEMITLNYN
jgi:hypothetical protein